MNQFKKRIKTYNAINSVLSEHGLELGDGAIIDTTLPIGINPFVCSLDLSEFIDGDVKAVLENPEIKSWLAGGRTEKIARFNDEQAQASAWSMRP